MQNSFLKKCEINFLFLFQKIMNYLCSFFSIIHPTKNYTAIIFRYTWEQWNDFKKFMESVNLRNSSAMNYMRKQFVEVLARHDLLRESDGLDKFRKGMNDYVSKLIQEKIRQNQNPKDCTNARTMVTKIINVFKRTLRVKLKSNILIHNS